MKTEWQQTQARAGWFATLWLLICLAPLGLAAREAPQETIDLQQWIDEKLDGGDLLAVTAAHLKDGKVTHYAGGTLTADGDTTPGPDTQFQIGSITKAFTDLLLAELVADGALSYDTTVRDVLGEDFSFQNDAVGDITLEELATHHSGLPRLPANLIMANPLDPYKGYDDRALRLGIGVARAKQPLAKSYSYSNFGVGLLGYLLGQAHGGGYETALKEKLLNPLGLEHTTFERSEEAANGYRNGEEVPAWTLEALAGAGALWGTTTDLLKLSALYIKSPLSINNPPLSTEWRGAGGEANSDKNPALPLKHNPNQDLQELQAGPTPFTITRVWHVGHANKSPIYWHNGGTGGYLSFFGFRPDTSEAIAILVAGGEDVTGLGLKVLGHNGEAGEEEGQPIDPELIGQYQINEAIGIGVTERNGRLFGQLSGQQTLPLTPIDDAWYAVTVADASLHFIREDGKVTAVELVQNGVIQRADKTSDVPASQAKEEIELSRADLEPFVGEYAMTPQAKFTIRLGENGLEAQITGQPFFPIFAKGDDVFFYKVVDAELHFERGEGGDVPALVLHQGAIVQRAERIDE